MEKVYIKDITGETILATEINEGCKRKFTLMKEDYISIILHLESPIYFKFGDYVDCDLGLFEICNLQKPTYNDNTGGYDYELHLDAHYWKWKNKLFKYTPENAGQEASWNLTATLDVQAGIVLRNLNALGYKYKGQNFVFSIDGTVENKPLLMNYNNINILDACFEMAKKWDCECWVTGNTINFGRCEFGEPVYFEKGVNVDEMKRSDSQSTYATRIYAFGSTRNIPSNYRPVDESVVVNGVVQRRLMLPVETPYIDAYPNMRTEEAVEQVIVFDDIYPRRVGTMSDITTHEYTDTIENEDGTTTQEKWNAYRFKDNGIKFSKEYILSSEELKITFQSGKLNGMTFVVTFNPDRKPEKNDDGTWNISAQLWEIVRNEDYGRKLPGDVLIPSNGDTYVLSGWDSTKISELGLVSNAEQELKVETEKYVSKSKIDPNTYDCKMMSDTIYSADGLHKLFEVGHKVNLINNAYFDNGRQSRIIGYEYKLDYPFDSPIYTVGETISYSRIGELESKVESLTLKGQTYTGGGGIYVIQTNDATLETDNNVYSAKRSKKEFHPKGGNESLNMESKDSTVHGNATVGGRVTTLNAVIRQLADTYDLNVSHVATLFNTVIKNALSSETFIPGFTGEGMKLWKAINGDWNLELDNITIRKAFYVFEMVIQQVRSINGALAITQGNGKIKSVTETTGATPYYVCEIEGDMSFLVGDFVRHQVFSSSRMKYYWVKVYEVSGKTISLKKSDFTASIPEEGDEIVQIGNDTNPARQGVLYLSAMEDGKPKFTVLDGVNSPSFAGKTKGIFGYIGDIVDPRFPVDNQPSGYGLYCPNAFLSGIFVLSSGKTLEDALSTINTQILAVPGMIQSSVTETKSYTDNKVAGIRIDGVNLLVYGDFEQGDISGTGNTSGTDAAYNAFTARTRNFIPVSGTNLIKNAFGGTHNIALFFYREDKTFISVNYNYVYPASIVVPTGAKYIKAWVRRVGDVPGTVVSYKEILQSAQVMVTEGVYPVSWNFSPRDILSGYAIQVGGRNLLRNSKDVSDTPYLHTIGYTAAYRALPRTLNAGETVILSYSGVTSNSIVGFTLYNTGEAPAETFPANQPVTLTKSYGHFRVRVATSAAFSVGYMKLETGTKATDWTPAPEDVQADIDSRVTTTVYNSGITQLSNQISSKVSQTDFNALGNRVSITETEISQTPDKISLAINNTNIGGENIMSNLSSNWIRGRINATTGSIETPTGTGWNYLRINIYNPNYISVNGGETLVFSTPKDGIKLYTCFIHQYTSTKTFIIVYPAQYYVRNYNETNELATLTLRPETKYIRIQLQCYFGSDSGDLYPTWFDTNKAQLEFGNKPTSWKQPYIDTVYSLNRTGIDIEQGKITLDAAKVVVTGDLFTKILNAQMITAAGAKIGGVEIHDSYLGIDASNTGTGNIGSFLAARYLGLRSGPNYFRVDTGSGNALQATIKKTTDVTAALSIENTSSYSSLKLGTAIQSMGSNYLYGYNAVQFLGGNSMNADSTNPYVEVSNQGVAVNIPVDAVGPNATRYRGYLVFQSQPGPIGSLTPVYFKRI